MDTYSGNPANYPADVRVVEDGDEANEINLGAGDRDNADRTANLDARLAAIGMVSPTSGGVTRHRTVGTLFDLANEGPVNDGDFRFVDGYGLYRYSAASGLAANAPFVIVPTGAPPNGRWFSMMFSWNGPSGMATRDGSGRIPIAQLPAGFFRYRHDAIHMRTGTAPVDLQLSANINRFIAAQLPTFPVVAGERIRARAYADFSHAATAATDELRKYLVIEIGGVPVVDQTSRMFLPSTTAGGGNVAATAEFTVVTAGTCGIRFDLARVTTAQPIAVGYTSLHVETFLPT